MTKTKTDLLAELAILKAALAPLIAELKRPPIPCQLADREDERAFGVTLRVGDWTNLVAAVEGFQ